MIDEGYMGVDVRRKRPGRSNTLFCIESISARARNTVPCVGFPPNNALGPSETQTNALRRVVPSSLLGVVRYTGYSNRRFVLKYHQEYFL